MPRIGTTGTNGVLNGRCKSGRRTRSTHTPAQTITNASSVPMLVISFKMPMGRMAGRKATKTPTTMDEIQGVRKRGCTAPAQRGSRPSRDMEKNTRDWPSSITSITVLRPMMVPIRTRNSPHCTPVSAMPSAMGAPTFKRV